MEEIKSSSGYFSVIDMFAVLLPGVLLVGGLNTLGAWSLLSEGLPKGEAAAWLSFGVEAYIAGHFIFILASGLDGPLYHRLLRHALDHDDGLSYRMASALKARYFGERLGAVDRLHPMNTFAWAKTVMALRAPRALAEVQRFEADSKFFRSLTLLMPALGVIALHRVGWSGVAGPAVIGATPRSAPRTTTRPPPGGRAVPQTLSHVRPALPGEVAQVRPGQTLGLALVAAFQRRGAFGQDFGVASVDGGHAVFVLKTLRARFGAATAAHFRGGGGLGRRCDGGGFGTGGRGERERDHGESEITIHTLMSFFESKV